MFLITSYADHQYSSSFAEFDIKLRREDNGDLHTDHPLYSFKFIQSKAQN